jgi:hypothetical protein
VCYTGSPNDSLRCASRARSSATDSPYLSTICRLFHPPSRMRSPSVPPCASQSWAKTLGKLVQMDPVDAGLIAPALDRLGQAPVGKTAPPSQPQAVEVGEGVPASLPLVAVQCLRGLVPERAGSGPRPCR